MTNDREQTTILQNFLPTLNRSTVLQPRVARLKRSRWRIFQSSAEAVARKMILSEGRRVLWCLATSLLTALTGALRDAQPIHQHLPHVVVHRVDVRVGPFVGMDRVVEPGGGEQN